MRQQLGNAAVRFIADDDGQAVRHGLQHDHREGVLQRGMGQHIGSQISWGDILQRAEEKNSVLQP